MIRLDQSGKKYSRETAIRPYSPRKREWRTAIAGYNSEVDMFRGIEVTIVSPTHLQCAEGSRNMSIVLPHLRECHRRGNIRLQIVNSAKI